MNKPDTVRPVGLLLWRANARARCIDLPSPWVWPPYRRAWLLRGARGRSAAMGQQRACSCASSEARAADQQHSVAPYSRGDTATRSALRRVSAGQARHASHCRRPHRRRRDQQRPDESAGSLRVLPFGEDGAARWRVRQPIGGRGASQALLTGRDLPDSGSDWSKFGRKSAYLAAFTAKSLCLYNEWGGGAKSLGRGLPDPCAQAFFCVRRFWRGGVMAS